jgi:chromosomal replication initiation ATPase DnaA
MSAVEYTEEQIEGATVGPPPPPGFSALELAGAVAREYGIDVPEMLGPSRFGHLVRARAALYRQLRQRGWSYPAIGRFAGGRDHTTVMYALRAGAA